MAETLLIAAGHRSGAGWRTDGTGDIGLRENHAFLREPGDVRCECGERGIGVFLEKRTTMLDGAAWSGETSAAARRRAWVFMEIRAWRGVS
jgi:hypothetical protein